MMVFTVKCCVLSCEGMQPLHYSCTQHIICISEVMLISWQLLKLEGKLFCSRKEVREDGTIICLIFQICQTNHFLHKILPAQKFSRATARIHFDSAWILKITSYCWENVSVLKPLCLVGPEFNSAPRPPSILLSTNHLPLFFFYFLYLHTHTFILNNNLLCVWLYVLFWLLPQRNNTASSLSAPLNHLNCMKPGWVTDDPASSVSSASNERLKYHLWEHS